MGGDRKARTAQTVRRQYGALVQGVQASLVAGNEYLGQGDPVA